MLRRYVRPPPYRETTDAEGVRALKLLTAADYALAIGSSLEQQGCDPSFAGHEAALLRRLVRDWPMGAIVERRLDEIVVRHVLKL